MQKWEYLAAYCNDGRNGLTVQHINGIELKNWERGPYISDWLNDRGREGWEMVAWSEQEGGRIRRLFMKRPLA